MHTLVCDLVNETSLSEFGFNSVVNIGTRILGSSKTCIDHMFVKSKSKSDVFPVVLETLKTDHLSTIVVLPMESNTPTESLGKHYIKYLNYKKLKRALLVYNWSEYYLLDDIEQLAHKLIDIVKHFINKNSYLVKHKKKTGEATSSDYKQFNQVHWGKEKIYKEYIKNPNN